jgi:ribosomal-protein-serine acetyltransferase
LLSLSLDTTAEMRALEPWNAAELLEFTDNNRQFLEPWLPWTQSVTNLEDTRAMLQRFMDRYAADGARLYGIWDDGRLVGGTMWRIFDASIGNCELGVWLSPQVTGRGLVTAAAQHMIDWAIEQRGMARIEWMCDTTNMTSKAVAKRLGMTHEATLRKVFPMHGRRVDMEVWAVLAEEWRARDKA